MIYWYPTVNQSGPYNYVIHTYPTEPVEKKDAKYVSVAAFTENCINGDKCVAEADFSITDGDGTIKPKLLDLGGADRRADLHQRVGDQVRLLSTLASAGAICAPAGEDREAM